MKPVEFQIIRKKNRPFKLWAIYENGFTKEVATAEYIIPLKEKIRDLNRNVNHFYVTDYNFSPEKLKMKI